MMVTHTLDTCDMRIHRTAHTHSRLDSAGEVSWDEFHQSALHESISYFVGACKQASKVCEACRREVTS